MFKAKLGTEQKGILLELLKLMAETDGNVTHDEMEMILKIKKMYRIKDYKYVNMTKDDIRLHLTEMKESDVLNILTHAVLLALADGKITTNEQVLIRSYFDLLSLDSASSMQKLIDKHGESDFDVRDFFLSNRTEQDILDESLDMLHDFSEGSIEDIDESLLMKMKRGPINKIWYQVMNLWDTVRDPKTEKKIKAICIGALIYLISPIDAIPDVIPFLGLTDDAGIIAFAISQLSAASGTRKIK